MSAPQHTRQPEYNPYPTLSNNSPSSSISSTLAASSENDLLSEGDNGGIKVSNKKRKRTRNRVKRKRRPNQKKAVINKVY